MPSRRSRARRHASCRSSWLDKACWNESAGFGRARRFFYAPSICFSSVSTIALLWLCFGAQLSAYFKRQRNDCNAPNTIIEWGVGDNQNQTAICLRCGVDALVGFNGPPDDVRLRTTCTRAFGED